MPPASLPQRAKVELRDGVWRGRLNADAEVYGGTGVGNFGAVETTPVPYHGRPYHGRPASLVLTLPPLGVLVLEHGAEAA